MTMSGVTRASIAPPSEFTMPAFSVLDLAPVPQGCTPGDALRRTLDLGGVDKVDSQIG